MSPEHGQTIRMTKDLFLKLYREGGGGLVLVFVGFLMLFFSVAGKTKLEPKTFIVLVIVFGGIIFLGGMVFMKEKISEFSGKVRVNAKEGERAVGFESNKPIKFKPGTEIEVETENVREVVGVKLGVSK